MGWSYAWAAEPGSGKTVSQDAVACRQVGDGLLLVVADGAGSAVQGGEGAQIVCRIFDEQAYQFLQVRPGDDDYIAKNMLKRILSEIDLAGGKNRRYAFATTFLGAVMMPWGAYVVHLGDGAAVVEQESCLRVVSHGAETEFVNVTRFVTDADALEHLQVSYIPGPIDRICLMTDGLQPLVIDDRTREPHPPFFDRVFQALAPQEGFDERASAWLSNMLKGDSVRSRTDDDTTIVLAKRSP